jgi:kynurenine formamidase
MKPRACDHLTTDFNEGKNMRKEHGFGMLLPTVALSLVFQSGCEGPEPSLEQVWQSISKKEFVDLTHAFAPGIPHWPGFPDEKAETIFWHDPGVAPGSGFDAQYFSHVGQWGTHADPPAHFVKAGRTLDQIGVNEMIMPLVVLDVHEKVDRNPDYTLRMEDVSSWESRHGIIPADAFVVMRTDWSKRWPDMAAMQNKDAKGISH